MKKTEMKEQEMFAKKYQCANAKVCGDICDHSHPHEHTVPCDNTKVCYKLAYKMGASKDINQETWRFNRAIEDGIEAGKCKRPICEEIKDEPEKDTR